ncbi:hypothetical protein, partial [Salmonella enterica]|uniref:hypothetical protein n=1 Tax=Salmonella enterica TaxID=28901 RepID=UPI00398C3722
MAECGAGTVSVECYDFTVRWLIGQRYTVAIAQSSVAENRFARAVKVSVADPQQPVAATGRAVYLTVAQCASGQVAAQLPGLLRYPLPCICPLADRSPFH